MDMASLHNALRTEVVDLLFSVQADPSIMYIAVLGQSLALQTILVREPEGWSVSYWGANSTIHF